MIILGLWVGCRPQLTKVHYQGLFSLEIGLSENKIALFQMPNSPIRHNLYIDMRDGLISISNSSQNKILTFTSYGDLLRAIYQPALNPLPTYLSSQEDQQLRFNRRGIEYEFHHLEDIAVGENNYIYAVNQLPADQLVVDRERQLVQDRVVVRIAPNIELHYIGQEGLGGTPFPAIHDIFVVGDNELIVVCKQNMQWQIYWYTPEGALRYRLDIDDAHFPALIRPSDIVELVQVVPDPKDQRLYLKIDFFNEFSGSDTTVQYGIEQVASRIYWIDLPRANYAGYIDIPSTSPSNAASTSNENWHISYNFLGVTEGQYMVLWGYPPNQNPHILVIGTNSDVVLRHEIAELPTNQLFSDYTLSPDGVIVALQGYYDRVDVVWWRMDEFLRSINRS